MSRHRAEPSAPAWVEALAVILRDSPALPGALCRGRADLFDATTDDQLAAAIGLCRRCPALAPCAAWADALPASAVHGVVAGRHPT